MQLANIAFCLMIFQVSPTPCADSLLQRPRPLDATLRLTVHDYRLQGFNFVDALTHVASEFQIPIGIEWVSTPRTRASIELTWKSATVQEVLQDVVKTQADYKMQVVGGVLRISTRDIVTDRENPLKLKIQAFDVQSAPVEVASRKLHAVIKEIIYPAVPGQVRRGGIAGSGAANLDDPSISVRLLNATLEDILDALALVSARKIWIVTFVDDPSRTPSGFRRTGTLWNNLPVPDSDQPVWDMLHWGDKFLSSPATKPPSATN
jgi:hypothetical protein